MERATVTTSTAAGNSKKYHSDDILVGGAVVARKIMKLDRKIVERNRRIKMKDLHSQLVSLIPTISSSSSKPAVSQIDQLELATSYIERLKATVEHLRKTREDLMIRSSKGLNGTTTNMDQHHPDAYDVSWVGCHQDDFSGGGYDDDDDGDENAETGRNNNGTSSSGNTVLLPVIELRHVCPRRLQVLLITPHHHGRVLFNDYGFRLSEVVNVFEDEGADVVTFSFSVVGDKVFHTIIAQIKESRERLNTSRVGERLQQLIC